MNSAPSVNDPIAAATQSQNHINSNLPVNPPMPRFSGVVSQYPMHNYGMSYPYFPMYPTPHGPQPFPFPQQYASLHGPSHKHQYNSGWNEAVSDPVTSDDAEASPTNTVINYPLVSDWLQGLTLDEICGCDNIPYTEKLTNNRILRLDDLSHFSQSDLCDLAGMKIGTAAHIVDWAKADKSSLDGQERKGKKMCI